ncbi:diguanylate cyclase [Mycobacterium sp. 2YAF39]|uniref:sensor domain-containing diguanylate cyclase n=1 Tax=Mycobacterium sp. 2YAF39 TaxID=3233033 RepID=UPI003F9CD563
MRLFVIFGAYAGAVMLYPYLESDGVALLWLPNGVLATALLKYRPHDWAYIYAVALVAEVVGDLTFNVVPHQALYFGLVNAIEATLFVFVAALIGGGRNNIGLLSVRPALAVILASVMVPGLTGALGAVGSVWTFDASYFMAWRNWWFGDSLGLLVGVPIGLLLRDAGRSVARRRRRPLALAAGGVGASFSVLSAIFASKANPWAAQQTSLATAVVLTLTFGAVGAPVAAVVTSIVTLIRLANGASMASVSSDQTLLFVVLAAVYLIAAASESADQAMVRLSRASNDLEKANARLAYLSRTDELTGLSNRRRLSEELELLWAWCVRDSKPIAMLMVDIDFFHQYNATCGHLAGDAVIKRIAGVIESCCRRRTDLAVRYGGEEFLLILPGVSVDHAQAIAGQIQEQVKVLNIPHTASPVAPTVTVSIGVLARTRATSNSAIADLERCDRLLYQAKRIGRNRIVVEPIPFDGIPEEKPARVRDTES